MAGLEMATFKKAGLQQQVGPQTHGPWGNPGCRHSRHVYHHHRQEQGLGSFLDYYDIFLADCISTFQVYIQTSMESTGEAASETKTEQVGKNLSK